MLDLFAASTFNCKILHEFKRIKRIFQSKDVKFFARGKTSKYTQNMKGASLEDDRSTFQHQSSKSLLWMHYSKVLILRLGFNKKKKHCAKSSRHA